MNDAKILIVEDNTDLAENIAEILEDMGYASTVAETAEAALALLDRERFDGVVTDLRLPGKSGIDLIEQLREQGVPVPVVVVTAFADQSTVETAEKLGALEVLPKPVDFERLFTVLDEFDRSTSKVLIVEDSEDLAGNIAEALREQEHVPIVAATVKAAIAQKHLPRVAIVDLRLPDGSGLEAAERLKARDPALKILVTTGYAEELADAKNEARIDKSGVDKPVLTKPFPLEQLLERVEQASKWPERKHS